MAPIYSIGPDFDFSLLDGSSCAFGVFDGVHTGHRFLLGEAVRTARESGGRSIALTFDVDPDELFHADRLRKLLTNKDRLAMLADTGVDAVCVLGFTPEFAANDPQRFLESTFEGHAPAFLHVGSDFAFGARAAGKVGDLRTWAEESGTQICAHNLVSSDGRPISATRIRLLLADCDIHEANRLLGRPYAMHDVVRPGRHDGRDMGFRTANLELPLQRQVVGEGVYGGYCVVDGRRYRAAVAVGVSPVFEESSTATVEVHILDFDQEIYGQDVWVELHEWLRPMIKFESVDELISTVKSNIAWVRENL